MTDAVVAQLAAEVLRTNPSPPVEVAQVAAEVLRVGEPDIPLGAILLVGI